MSFVQELIIDSPGGKKVNASYNGVVIETDQSAAHGGDESAPEPFTLFLASIGTCAGIFVYSFCANKGIDASGIRIIQKNIPAENGKGVGTVSLTIELPDSFPEKYRDAIVRVADLCTVKKHILNPPEFEIKTGTV